MKIEIDISGQIQQLNYDSALGFRRENGIEKGVYLKSKTKKKIIKKQPQVRLFFCYLLVNHSTTSSNMDDVLYNLSSFLLFLSSF